MLVAGVARLQASSQRTRQPPQSSTRSVPFPITDNSIHAPPFTCRCAGEGGLTGRICFCALLPTPSFARSFGPCILLPQPETD